MNRGMRGIGKSLVLGVALVGALVLAAPALSAVADPTATITTPRNGATYALGQAVSTSFTCADGAGGPGISSCVDQNGRTSGGGLDTSTPGTHTLTVTATSSDGQTGTASATYTVTPSSEDPRCQRFRDKLKRQKAGLARAKTKRKRAFIRHNIGQTKTRLRVFNCSTS